MDITESAECYTGCWSNRRLWNAKCYKLGDFAQPFHARPIVHLTSIVSPWPWPWGQILWPWPWSCLALARRTGRVFLVRASLQSWHAKWLWRHERQQWSTWTLSTQPVSAAMKTTWHRSAATVTSQHSSFCLNLSANLAPVERVFSQLHPHCDTLLEAVLWDRNLFSLPFYPPTLHMRMLKIQSTNWKLHTTHKHHEECQRA